MANLVSDRRLWLNADRSKVVEEGSEDAAFLLVAEGGTVSEEDVAKYGLSAHEYKAPSQLEQERAGLADAEARGATEEARVRRARIADFEAQEKAAAASATKMRSAAPANKAAPAPADADK